MWIAFRSYLLCQWIEGEKYLYPNGERILTNDNILWDYNKQRYVAISESGRVTEAETWQYLLVQVWAAALSLAASALPPAPHHGMLPVGVPGDRQISTEKTQAPRGSVSKERNQATLVPNETEKSGQTAPAEASLHPPFSFPDAFVNLVWINSAPSPVCTREQSRYPPAHSVSNR